MSRYIDADELLKHKTDHEMISTHLIYNAPTADVRPVVRGEWIKTDAYPHRIFCSVCYKTYLRNEKWVEELEVPMNFCPNCGADMRGDLPQHKIVKSQIKDSDFFD